MAYLLDTNTFIESKNQFYRFAVCPGFWDWITLAAAEGRVLSLDKVRDELFVVEDDLSNWASGLPPTFFKSVDAKTVQAAGAISEWTLGKAYRPAAVQTFFDSADYWLIAFALAHNHVLVTRELPSPESKRVIKIPDVCVGLGVKFKSPFDMLTEEGAEFVLQ